MVSSILDLQGRPHAPYNPKKGVETAISTVRPRVLSCGVYGDYPFPFPRARTRSSSIRINKGYGDTGTVLGYINN